MPEISIKLSLSTGEVKIEAQGFKGSACKDATAFLEKALGQATDFQRKAEWYEENLKKTGCCLSNLCG